MRTHCAERRKSETRHHSTDGASHIQNYHSPQQVLCRQRTIQNQMATNNLQCEIVFHTEANSQTK